MLTKSRHVLNCFLLCCLFPFESIREKTENKNSRKLAILQYVFIFSAVTTPRAKYVTRIASLVVCTDNDVEIFGIVSGITSVTMLSFNKGSVYNNLAAYYYFCLSG